jgi:lipopolysaccharide/colanic/teichoic acid biosynthesis glycosyltransferase
VKTLRNPLLIRIMDLVLVLLSSPFLVLIWIFLISIQCILLGWPPLFLQNRLGKEEVPFLLIKWRSIPTGIRKSGRGWEEEKRLPRWCLWLRRLHLDESLEPIYVLLGKMSLVGPRPLMPKHSQEHYNPWRFKVLPGWTGYSQVFLARRGLLPSRLQTLLDNHWSKSPSLAKYCWILGATLLSPFRKRSLPLKGEPLAYRNTFLKDQGLN